ncbi:MAG: hypothetical protein ACYDAG_11740 [Chloroflexota bacterium]
MSQVNVNPGGPGYRDEGTSAAAAGINLLAVVLIIAFVVVIAVVAYGALAGGWFGAIGGTNGGNVNVTVQQSPAASHAPAAQMPASRAPLAQSPAPAASK